MDNIIVALIAGGCSLLGVVITNIAANTKIAEQLKAAQGITDNNLKNIKDNMENLTQEVRRHNSFGDRITALETRQKELQERVDRMEARMERLHSKEV
ncbi:MAG: hypothetical protein IKN54_06090 [Lachnospiraceae bacterium]|nr:hypothetical protein [Lachnospiraceae bacterium]